MYEFRIINGRTARLCNPGLTKSQVRTACENFINDLKISTNFNALCEELFDSGDPYELVVETCKDYREYGSEVNVVFGKMEPDNIELEHIRKYMDKRGVKSRVQANREKAFISRVSRWTHERGKVKMNPCQDVKQFKELARARYISDKEYDTLYNAVSTLVKVAMELAYLCYIHQRDIFNFKKNQILNEGILVQQSKTAISRIKAQTKRLGDTVNPADSIPFSSGMVSTFVIHQPSDLRYARDAFGAQ